MQFPCSFQFIIRSIFLIDPTHSKKIWAILYHDIQPTGNSKGSTEEEYSQRGNSRKGTRWVSSTHIKFSSSVSLPGPAESHWAAPHCAQLKTWNSTPWQSKEGWESLSEPAQEVEYWPNLITGHLLPFSPLLLAHCDIQAISHRTQQSAAVCTPLPRASPYTPQHAAVIAFPISPQRQQLPWQPAMILISLVCFQGQHTRAGTWAHCRHAPGGRRTYHQIQRVENTLGSEKP